MIKQKLNKMSKFFGRVNVFRSNKTRFFFVKHILECQHQKLRDCFYILLFEKIYIYIYLLILDFSKVKSNMKNIEFLFKKPT